MKWLTKLKEDSTDYLFDHPNLKKTLSFLFKLFVTALSAFLFAYGFRAFIAPTIDCVEGWFPKDASGNIPDAFRNKGITEADYVTPLHLISGGASGCSQVIIRFIEIFVDITHLEKMFTSLLYILLNIPLLILSYKKISKQFTFFTLVNVGLVSLFNFIIPDAWIYNVVNIYTDTLARCICGGLTTGISSSLSMMINTSAGGTDIISIYISEKKSAPVGKYGMIINGIIISFYTLFSVIGRIANPTWNQIESNTTISLALYTIIYYFIATQVVDVLNVRNRKLELQIFTSHEELSQVLIHAFPHSCTIVNGKGAFSGKEKNILYMVISKKEAKKAVALIKQADPEAFVAINDLKQVYGRFFIKPIE